MTVGIYKLEFMDNSFYIGRSVSVESRYKNHISTLKRGTNHSTKLQNKFNNLQHLPILLILEECSLLALKEREVYWINFYNALNLGLNTFPGGEDLLYGEKHPNSKYTNVQIIETIKLLGVNYIDTLTHSTISEITGVTVSTIKDIIGGRAHVWVKEKYPDLYKSMIDCKDIRRNNSLKNLNPFANKKTAIYPEIISPNGITYRVEHLTNFCNEHGLTASNLSKVFKGERNHHKGWKLSNESVNILQ